MTPTPPPGDGSGPEATVDPAIRRRNRFFLIALLALSMLPLGGALYLYYGKPFAIPGAQTNNGALLDPPAQLVDLDLIGDAGVVATGETRKWRLVVVAPNDCSEPCLERLHMLRQVQRLLGRDSDRVLRIVAFPGGADEPVEARVRRSFPRTNVVAAPRALVPTVLADRELHGGTVPLPADGFPETGVLTVDPLGNVILYHSLEQIGEPMLSDLKRVLRLSNIG